MRAHGGNNIFKKSLFLMGIFCTLFAQSSFASSARLIPNTTPPQAPQYTNPFVVKEAAKSSVLAVYRCSHQSPEGVEDAVLKIAFISDESSPLKVSFAIVKLKDALDANIDESGWVGLRYNHSLSLPYIKDPKRTRAFSGSIGPKEESRDYTLYFLGDENLPTKNRILTRFKVSLVLETPKVEDRFEFACHRQKNTSK